MMYLGGGGRGGERGKGGKEVVSRSRCGFRLLGAMCMGGVRCEAPAARFKPLEALCSNTVFEFVAKQAGPAVSRLLVMFGGADHGADDKTTHQMNTMSSTNKHTILGCRGGHAGGVPSHLFTRMMPVEHASHTAHAPRTCSSQNSMKVRPNSNPVMFVMRVRFKEGCLLID